MAANPWPHARCTGFTIIEILAALLVIAVGIIGVAAVYSDQTHPDPEVQLHLQAAALAETIAERVRVTKDGRAGYAATIGVVCDPQSGRASPQDRTAQEAACWGDEVERTLPSGLGSIKRDLSTTPASYVIAVSWSAPGSGTASYVIRVFPQAEAPAAQPATRAAN